MCCSYSMSVSVVTGLSEGRGTMLSAERDRDRLELMLDLSRESCCMGEGEGSGLYDVCSGSFIGVWNSSVAFESCIQLVSVGLVREVLLTETWGSFIAIADDCTTSIQMVASGD